MSWRDRIIGTKPINKSTGSWRDRILDVKPVAKPEDNNGIVENYIKPAAMGISQGGSFGYADEIEAGLRALGKKLRGDTRPIKDIYNDIVSNVRSEYKSAEEKSPVISGTAEIVGSLASPINKVFAPLSAAGKLTGPIIRGASEGAAYGYGKGGKEGALTQGAFGAIIPASLSSLRAAKKGINSARKLITRSSQKELEDIAAAKFLGVPKNVAGKKKYAETLINEGIIDKNPIPSKIRYYKNAKEIKDLVGEDISSIYDKLETPISSKEIAENLKNKINYLKSKPSAAANKSAIKQLTNIAEEYGKENRLYSPQDIFEARKVWDKVAYEASGLKQGAQRLSSKKQTAEEVRNTLQNILEKQTETELGPDAAEQLLNLNKRYSKLSEVTPLLEKKIYESGGGGMFDRLTVGSARVAMKYPAAGALILGPQILRRSRVPASRFKQGSALTGLPTFRAIRTIEPQEE